MVYQNTKLYTCKAELWEAAGCRMQAAQQLLHCALGWPHCGTACFPLSLLREGPDGWRETLLLSSARHFASR